MRTDRLSPRQREAVEALLLEETQKAAAAAMGISVDTLRAYLRAVRRKLGAATTEQAVYILASRGDLVVPVTHQDPAA